MPEGRSWPWKFLPRRGVALSVTFGEPVPQDDVRKALTSVPPSVDGLLATTASAPARTLRETQVAAVLDDAELDMGSEAEEERSLEKAREGWLGDATDAKLASLHEIDGGEPMQKEMAWVRGEVTAVLQREVEKLGKRVLGAR